MADSEGSVAPASPWKDLPFFGLFWGTFLWIIIALAAGPFSDEGKAVIAQQEKAAKAAAEAAKDNESKVDMSGCLGGLVCGDDMFATLGISIAGAFVFTALFGVLLKKFPETIMKIALFFNVAILVVFAVIMFAANVIPLAVVLLVFAVILCVYFYCQRNRIAFACLLIKCSVQAASKFPNLITATMGGIMVACAYLLLWAGAFAKNSASQNQTDQQVAYSVFLIGGWHMTTIYYGMYCIVCGVIGSWWFSTSEKSDTPNPVWNSVKRALTWSFGSVAMGALLIFIITQLCKQARKAAAKAGVLGFIIVRCCVNPLERLAKIFSGYAFVHVAVYGKSFFDASKDTAQMFKERGIGSIVNADFSGRVLKFSSGIVMVLTGCLTSGVLYAFMAKAATEMQNPTTMELIMKADETNLILLAYKVFAIGFLILFFFIGAVLGYAVSYVACAIITACISTIFVCFAENPEALAAKDPELYNVFNEKWDKAEGKSSGTPTKV